MSKTSRCTSKIPRKQATLTESQEELISISETLPQFLSHIILTYVPEEKREECTQYVKAHYANSPQVLNNQFMKSHIDKRFKERQEMKKAKHKENQLKKKQSVKEMLDKCVLDNQRPGKYILPGGAQQRQ